jgi:23S rRNA pseudouridine2605 synthase
VEITIHEGRKHQVKRMFEQIGHPVIRLKRVQFGPLNLGTLPPGQTRYLTDKEANELRHLLIAPETPRLPKQEPSRSRREFPPVKPMVYPRPRPTKSTPLRSNNRLAPSGKTGQARPNRSKGQPRSLGNFPPSTLAAPLRPRPATPNLIRGKKTQSPSGTSGQARPRRQPGTFRTRINHKP